MPVRVFVTLLVSWFMFCPRSAAEAAVITFNDRTLFQTAIAAPLNVESFDALSGTVVRVEAGLTVGGVSFVGIGDGGLNGFLTMVVDNSTFSPLLPGPSLSVVNHLRITFPAPVSAVGFDAFVTSGVLFAFNVPMAAAFSNGDATIVTLPARETFVGFQTTSPFQMLDLTTISSFLSVNNFYSPSSAQPNPIPEPATLMLVGIGTAIVGFRGRRRARP